MSGAILTERDFRPATSEEVSSNLIDLPISELNVSPELLFYTQRLLQSLDESETGAIVIPFEPEQKLEGVRESLTWVAEQLTARKIDTEVGLVDTDKGEKIPAVFMWYQKPFVPQTE